jgi:hypothetical protein
MWFWKYNKSTAAPVTISNDCVKKLPAHVQKQFGVASLVMHGKDNPPTHEVVKDDDDNFALGMIGLGVASISLTEIVMPASDDYSSQNISDSGAFGGFGGGSGGGAGAGGSFDETPLEEHSVPAFDSPPMADTGPTMDSVDSFDNSASDAGGGSDAGGDSGGSD